MIVLDLFFFIVALTMTGVAVFLFFYLIFLQSVIKQHKRRIAELERHCNSIVQLLAENESQVSVADRNEIFLEHEIAEEEAWPEMIDDERIR